MNTIQFPSSTANGITDTISAQIVNFLPIIVLVIAIPAVFYIADLLVSLMSRKRPIDNEIDTTQNDY